MADRAQTEPAPATEIPRGRTEMLSDAEITELKRVKRERAEYLKSIFQDIRLI